VLQNDFKIAFAPEVASTLLQNRLESSSNWLQYCFKTASQIQKMPKKCFSIASKCAKQLHQSCFKIASIYFKLLQTSSKTPSAQKYLAKLRRIVPSAEKYVKEPKFSFMQPTRLSKHI